MSLSRHPSVSRKTRGPRPRPSFKVVFRVSLWSPPTNVRLWIDLGGSPDSALVGYQLVFGSVPAEDQMFWATVVKRFYFLTLICVALPWMPSGADTPCGQGGNDR